MREILIANIAALPDDALQVDGYVDGVPYRAFGWQSALTNHFDSAASEDGHRKKGAKPRSMSDTEAKDYFRRLLLEAAGAGDLGEIDFAKFHDPIPAEYATPPAEPAS